MKTTEERLAALEAEIAAIPRRGKWLSSHEHKLREFALAYARIKLFRATIDADGVRSTHGRIEADAIENHYVDCMKRAAIDILHELGVEDPRKP